jgi:OOP family OmpA-OmpF porin
MNNTSKYAATTLALSFLSGCAGGLNVSHETSDYLLCGTAGAIVGGMLGGAVATPVPGIAIGTAIALLACPTEHQTITCSSLAPDGAILDANDCPLDPDGDGIFDGLDLCPHSQLGEKVTNTGCPTMEEVKKQLKTPTQDATGHEENTKEDNNQLADKTILAITDINFETDKSDLTKKSKTKLNEVAALFKQASQQIKIEIKGHADNRGTKAYNYTLSLNRANAVMKYLINMGISPAQLVTRGMGETAPIASNASKEGRQKNRRVEFVILK